jgi:hypothetical protein
MRHMRSSCFDDGSDHQAFRSQDGINHRNKRTGTDGDATVPNGTELNPLLGYVECNDVQLPSMDSDEMASPLQSADSSLQGNGVDSYVQFQVIESEHQAPSPPHDGKSTIDDAEEDESPERHWHGEVAPRLSRGHRDLLAERLFCHVWEREGRDVALALVRDNTDEGILRRAADARFDAGCRLWGEEKHGKALWELQRCRSIHEVRNGGMSLLHVLHRNNKDDHDENNAPNKGRYAAGTKDAAAGEASVTPVPRSSSMEINTVCPSPTESHAQLHYALGTVQLGLNEHTVALREYRRAMQISFLGLGENHRLTGAIGYMIRTTLLTIGLSSPNIHHYLTALTDALRREGEGDDLFASGEYDEALLEYVGVRFLKDRDVQAQARIRSKMASAFEEKGDHVKALELWSTVMALYAGCSSIGVDHPLSRHATVKFVENRARVGGLGFEI